MSTFFRTRHLVEGKCMDSYGKEINYYDYVKLPEFPGGSKKLMQYMAKELKYSKVAREKDIEGRVRLRFTVKKDGTISDIEIIESVHEELDREAMRVVRKMPKWIPGRLDGEIERFTFHLPVAFVLR